MAIGLRRKVRLDSRRDNQKITRDRNGLVKQAERDRRDRRIIEKIKSTQGSYAPEVKSWLAARTGKSFKHVTDEDIKQIVG
ncbi:MAG: hypothetical protein ACOCXA_04150 [Planctomycetota bacterium]